MLFEKEKQLILAEKERMLSLYHIDPEELVICEEVGRGASAVVFRGLWNGTTIALKALKKTSLFEVDAAAQGFFREIEILSSLRYFGFSSHLLILTPLLQDIQTSFSTLVVASPKTRCGW